MAETELTNRLLKLAKLNGGELGRLANQLAEDLQDINARKRWSLLDVRREFEAAARLTTSSRWSTSRLGNRVPAIMKRVIDRTVSLLSTITPILYLVPVGLTWYHLRSALNGFSSLDLPDGESLDFLTFWSGAEGEYSGMLLPDVAIVIVAVLGLIASLHLLVGDVKESVIGSHLNEIIRDVQLELARSRAVTPEEMSDALTTAAQFMEQSLSRASVTLESLSTLSTGLSGVTNSLLEVSNSLIDSASRIESVVAPLKEVPSAMERALVGIESLPDRLTNLQREIDKSSANLLVASEIIRESSIAGNNLLSNSKSAAESISMLSSNAAQTVKTIEQAGEMISRWHQIVSSQTPHTVVMREFSEQMKEILTRIEQIADEFRFSANEYRRVNDEFRGKKG